MNGDVDWTKWALCQGKPTRSFFPPDGMPVMPWVEKMCANCPVRPECAQHALKHERHGFWAGTTPSARQKARKRLGIQLESPEVVSMAPAADTRCGTNAGYTAHRRKGENCESCKVAHRRYVTPLPVRRLA